MAKKTHEEVSAYIAGLMERARKAQAILDTYTQEQVDKLIAIIAYEMTRLPVRQELADLALLLEYFAAFDFGKNESSVKLGPEA